MSTSWLSKNRWIWPLIASLLLWIAASIVKGHVSGSLLIANAVIATFLALVSFGQMVVMTSGDGSIDISLPYVLTLSAYVSAAVMNNGNGRMATGLLAALGVSLLVGTVNGVLVALVRIPPIITTLAVGYMVETFLELSSTTLHGQASPLLAHETHAHLAGIPLLILFTLVVALVIAFLLRRTYYGSWLTGMGQSRRAAYLVGIGLNRMMITNFVFSALMGGLAGLLLGAYTGGAFITMGTPYLLTSIGAVVIGGTLVSGGLASIPGTLAGAFLLTWLATFVQIVNVPSGAEDIIEGLVVIAIAAIPSFNKVESNR